MGESIALSLIFCYNKENAQKGVEYESRRIDGVAVQ